MGQVAVADDTHVLRTFSASSAVPPCKHRFARDYAQVEKEGEEGEGRTAHRHGPQYLNIACLRCLLAKYKLLISSRATRASTGNYTSRAHGGNFA